MNTIPPTTNPSATTAATSAVDVELWHNPACSKSRETLALLQHHGVTPRVRLYLKDPPDRATLVQVAARLGARALLRDEAGAPAQGATDDEVIDALVAEPRLLQRPVVLANGRAAMGRPPEAVLALLRQAP